MGSSASAEKMWRPADRFRLFDSSKVDFLCRSVVAAAYCSAISTLANNNFFRILDLARRAEDFAGDWMPFIPREILGALYQKVTILNQLRSGDIHLLNVN